MSIDRWMDKEGVVHIYNVILLLLLLSHFSCVQLCAAPQTAAHQALLSLGFSRHEYWSGLPSPSPMHESENWKWSCSVVSDSLRPHALQPTRLLHHGIFQARVLEWGAIALSTMWYYSTIKKNAFESVLMKWTNLEPILQSEVSQKEIQISYTDAYIWNF